MELIDDIMIHILRQLDPAHRPDRYVLHSCLLVSRFYFEFAADRLWSTVILATNPDWHGRSHCKPLLAHAYANNPPSSDGSDAPERGGTGWRNAIYLRAITAIECLDLWPNPTIVPPERLLPWLPRLDSVGATAVGDMWAAALVDRFADKAGHSARRLRYLAIRSGDSRVGALVGPSVRSMRFTVDRSARDGEFATLLGSLITGSAVRGGSVEALRFEFVSNPSEIEAVTRCISAQGGTLRRLHLCGGDMIEKFPGELIADVLREVGMLTHLQLELPYRGTANATELVSGLLTSNRASLISLEIIAWKPNILEALPLIDLRRLRSLKLDFIFLYDHSVLAPWLGAMSSLTRLQVEVKKWQLMGLVNLMDVVNEMRGLQELSVDLDRHIMGSTDEVVRVRMNHLRKIRLMWYVPSTDVTARLFIVDWEEVKRVGLPSLEELEINIGNFDQGSFGEDQKEFPAILYDAVLDVAKTPALVFADVDLNGKTEQYFFKLKGGRGNFCAKKLAEMREEFEGIV